MEEHVKYVTSRLSTRFWEIIGAAKTDWPRFQTLLRGLDPKSLWRLYWTYRAAMGILRDEEYRVYADPSLSEDGLDELAAWIVAQGRDAYMGIVENPTWMLYDAPENAYPLGHPLSEIVRASPHNFSLPTDDDYFFR